MKKSVIIRSLFVITLVALTIGAMVYNGRANQITIAPQPGPLPSGPVAVNAALTQTSLPAGGDGALTLSLTMTAAAVTGPGDSDGRHVDLVIVLDRSGSMEGEKIRFAKQAVMNLLAALSPSDRFALVSYSDEVLRHSGLMPVNAENRRTFESIVGNIGPGGSTNLGAGLQEGLNILASDGNRQNAGKVILISDGLANRGVTDEFSLGRMASTAVSGEFAVSTIGVGLEFNERLMTTIADRGAGNYYFLENPNAFAEIFRREFLKTRVVAASGVEVRVPLKPGMSLTHAGGYPIETRNGTAIFRPGNLYGGQARKLFLTLTVPVDQVGEFELEKLELTYTHQGQRLQAKTPTTLKYACVKDRQAALASIDRDEWEKKVVQEDFNALREEVAEDIKKGDEQAAMDKIQRYRRDQTEVNAVVGSEAVRENLEGDVNKLEDMVKDSFSGAPGEVDLKQKKNSKTLQFQGYGGRRGKY